MPSIEQLRAVVSAGQPPQPTSESPGAVLSACREMLEMLRQTAEHGQAVTPEEMVQGLAHLFDMNAWRVQVHQWEQMKALLEQAERSVLVTR